MKYIFGSAAYIIFWITAFASWINAIINDADSKSWGWLIVDIIASPVGALRGFLMFLGVI